MNVDDFERISGAPSRLTRSLALGAMSLSATITLIATSAGTFSAATERNVSSSSRRDKYRRRCRCADPGASSPTAAHGVGPPFAEIQNCIQNPADQADA